MKRVVEIGCGARKIEGAVGIDLVRIPGVDIVADIERGLPLRSDSVDVLHAYHVLEHVDDFIALMGEVWRVLRDGGHAHVRVPHAASTYMTWKDPTHRRGLEIATFTYFDDTYFDGKAFSYYSPARFRIETARLMFSAKGTPAPMPAAAPGVTMPLPEPRAIRFARKFINPIFDAAANHNRATQYACERFWGPIVGVEEIHLLLRAIK